MTAPLGNVVNHRAPVTCYARGDKVGGPLAKETRQFKCLSEFLKWYVPRHHGAASVISRYLFTDVLLETLTDPPQGPAAAVGRRAAGPRTRSAVEVDGKQYRSTWAAFQALGLGDERECVKFRTELKHKLRAEFRGRKFTIVAAG